MFVGVFVGVSWVYLYVCIAEGVSVGLVHVFVRVFVSVFVGVFVWVGFCITWFNLRRMLELWIYWVDLIKHRVRLTLGQSRQSARALALAVRVV